MIGCHGPDEGDRRQKLVTNVPSQADSKRAKKSEAKLTPEGGPP